uniref:Uncharacterized protein n=1 Tax=Oryza rufipogon TaxID=4529 RepID=A0A0E0NDG1_ORYRU
MGCSLWLISLGERTQSDKAYPRDPFQVGRVRVQLKKNDGSPVNPEITTKILISPSTILITEKMLMLHVAELVPKHLGRTRKQEPATSSSAAGTVKSTKGRRKKRLHHQILAV